MAGGGSGSLNAAARPSCSVNQADGQLRKDGELTWVIQLRGPSRENGLDKSVQTCLPRCLRKTRFRWSAALWHGITVRSSRARQATVSKIHYRPATLGVVGVADSPRMRSV